MSTVNPLRLPIADLLRRPGAARSFDVEAQVSGISGGPSTGASPGWAGLSTGRGDLGNGVAEVPPDATIRARGTLEHVADGVVVRGAVDAPWQASCSRCLRPVAGAVSVHVDELFEPTPLAGETYPLEDDVLDLSPLVRDVLLLELPAAPLCAEDCAGICPSCGADRNEVHCDCSTEESDSRWAALRSLDL